MNIEKSLQDYCNNLLERKDQEYIFEIQDLKESVNNIKVENGKYHLEAMKIVKSVRERVDKFYVDSDEITSSMERTNEIVKILKNNQELFRIDIFERLEEQSNTINTHKETHEVNRSPYFSYLILG
jgi:hypothetical protein